MCTLSRKVRGLGNSIKTRVVRNHFVHLSRNHLAVSWWCHIYILYGKETINLGVDKNPMFQYGCSSPDFGVWIMLLCTLLFTSFLVLLYTLFSLFPDFYLLGVYCLHLYMLEAIIGTMQCLQLLLLYAVF